MVTVERTERERERERSLYLHPDKCWVMWAAGHTLNFSVWMRSVGLEDRQSVTSSVQLFLRPSGKARRFQRSYWWENCVLSQVLFEEMVRRCVNSRVLTLWLDVKSYEKET